ncbi:MAG: amicyanin [Thermodesulfobacteriota bacterium]|nr:MAG: amicyanin [Thermodesulfobacteriota bacterium]
MSILKIPKTVATIVAAVFILSAVTHVIAEEPKEHIVEIRNLVFTPNELTVAPGDTITWINYDFVPHTVTANDESWDSGLIEANGKWQIVVTEDMYKSYFCRFHPNMKAGLKLTK